MSGVTLSGGSVSGVGTGAVELTETSSRALKLQTDAPHLVSMGGGRLSTAVTLHPIPQGRVTLGSGAGVDIPVQGTGVLPLHCHIENSEGVVTIYPLSENLSIDGVPIAGPTRLSQGVMLTIGRSNYMRFNHPAEAKLMKSVLPNPRISMAPITFEVDEEKNQRKPPVAPKRSPRGSLSDSSGADEPATASIKMKVSKFEYLAAQNFKKSISPKVFSSNLVTVNTPAKDVLGRAPPDLQNFTKNIPQSALNYSDSGVNEKLKQKMPERLFGRKSPQYVNVTINETKNINNRVIIYENGCISKTQNFLNVNLDHNDLNNAQKVSSCSKNINVNRVMVPSPGYNRNQAPYYKSPTEKLNYVGKDGMNGSLEDLAQRNCEAEMRRNKAQAERIREQEIEKAEQARLEEILNMCAEYEKQAQFEKHNKVTPNRIKTNGSLPRDKRSNQSPYGSPPAFTPPPSPRNAEQIENGPIKPPRNHSYENVTLPRDKSRFHYENVEIYNSEQNIDVLSPYENVGLNRCYPGSPRTRIRTCVTPNKDSVSPKDPPTPDNKFTSFKPGSLEKLTLKEIPSVNKDTAEIRKATPTKFILPLEDPADEEKQLKNATQEIEDLLQITQVAVESIQLAETKGQQTEEETKPPVARQNTLQKQRLEKLRKEKQEKLVAMAKIKRQLAEIETQAEELFTEFEMEKALIAGEYKSKQNELEKLEGRKMRLMKRAQKIEASMQDCQRKQERDQEESKAKLDQAQQNLRNVEEKLSKATKPSDEYDEIFEDYLKAQEILDNEKKTFEDLEFHQLEEEADWLASREELQREILDLSQRIEHIKDQILDLERQKVDTADGNAFELKNIERQRMEEMIKLEEVRNEMKLIDAELGMFGSQDSEPDVSSDSDSSDKGKEEGRALDIMSCSMIVSGNVKENPGLMTMSFNEEMLQETAVLDGGSGKKWPSQDDIDRISKVTSNAPLATDEQKGSLGKKTLESLREIERQRHLLLCQQGSQVIEQERQKMLALKQKVQQEVMNSWAQMKQEALTVRVVEIDEKADSVVGSKEQMEQKSEGKQENGSNKQEVARPESDITPESPRPLSETSELSVEVGGTLNSRRRANNARQSSADKHRPLTRYLPIRGSDLDLRQHIESAGHQVVLCPHVIINSSSCRGFLHKKGSKLNGWSRRWFVFDRNKHTFVYYADKTEKKPRGGSYFQAIEEVYLDHLNSVKSPNPNLTFIVKTHERFYYLMAPSPEAMRIWVDVIFTGAEGYQEFEHGT